MKKLLSVLLVSVLFWSGPALAIAPQCSSLFLPESLIDSTYDRLAEHPRKFVRENNSLAHLRVFYDYQKLFTEATADRSSPLHETHFADIIKKTLSSFSREPQRLTAADLNYISSHPQRKKMFEGVLYFQALTEAPFRLLQSYSQYSATRGGTSGILEAPTMPRRVQHLLQSLYNGPLKYMLLIPNSIDLPGGLTPTARIFKKLWQDPSYTPTPAEVNTLKEYQAEAIFKERKDFLNENRQWVKIRRFGDYALNAAVALALIQAFNWYEQLKDPASTVTVDTFTSPLHQLADDEVRVYNETVPFPHMALEISGVVYSYGQTHMTTTTVGEYLRSGQIMEGIQGAQANQDQNLLQRAIGWSGLNRIERVVQTAKLKIGVEAKGRLRRHLEMQTGKRYRNQTLVMDCATMIVQALKANANTPIPTVIDPSPSQVMLYLASLKTLGVKNQLGQNLVQDILQVRMGPASNQSTHVWRNLYINMVESRLFISFFHFSAAQRIYLEARYGRDGMQFWDDETLDYFKLWEKDLREEFAAMALTGQLAIFKDSLTTQDPGLRSALKAALDAYFDLEVRETQSLLDSMETRFEDIFKATLRLNLLLETKQKMYREAGFAEIE